MRIRLIRVPWLERDRTPTCPVRILEIDGKSPVLVELNEWRRSSASEFKKILSVLETIETLPQAPRKNISPDDDDHANFEISCRGGRSARVFFFYDHRKQPRWAIVTHAFLKTKSSRAEQDRQFKRSRLLKALILGTSEVEYEE